MEKGPAKIGDMEPILSRSHLCLRLSRNVTECLEPVSRIRLQIVVTNRMKSTASGIENNFRWPKKAKHKTGNTFRTMAEIASRDQINFGLKGMFFWIFFRFSRDSDMT